MEKAKIVWVFGIVAAVCNVCMVISMLSVAGKTFVEPAFEGFGTQRLFKIDYGIVTQGIFTAFMGAFICYWHWKMYTVGGANKVNIMYGMLIMMCVMLLQTSILWGNQAITANAIDRCPQGNCGSVIHQQCSGLSDYKCDQVVQGDSPSSCINSTALGRFSFGGYMRTYKGNQKLKPGCDSAVAFSIFSLLIHMTELGLLRKWREEIIQGGKGVLSSESSGEYQRL